MLRNWQDVSNWYKNNGFPIAAANMGEIRDERNFHRLVIDIVEFDAKENCLSRNLKAQRKFFQSNPGLRKAQPLQMAA